MRIVIKIGSSTLTHKSGKLNIRRVEKLCKIISDIKNEGHEIIMVSSGAIAMGVGKLNLSKKPDDVESKQALAAVGQCELMYVYDKLFSEYNHCVAQLLVTGADLEDEQRKVNFQHTMDKLLEMSALPIINENDTIGTKEILIGDNDNLGAIVAINVQADLLILLSDIEGLYTADPHKDPNARLIHEVRVLDEEIISLAGGSGNNFGTGGMHTKLEAASLCMNNNCDMIIANGEQPENLYKIIENEVVGTYFHSKKN